MIDEFRAGLRQLAGNDEAGVNLWLATPHPELDGDVPPELFDAGEVDIVFELIEYMVSGAPA